MGISANEAERSPPVVPTPSPAPTVSVWILQQTALEVLREVVARCDAASIAVLPVKGIVTSRILYRDVAERAMTDVDVRVRRRDLGALQRVAGAAGWRCTRVLRSYGNLTYDFGLLSLDVEAGVGPPGLCALGVDAMLERSARIELAPGCLVSIPELHDHAVLLAVNAFKDKLVGAQPWAISDLERVVTHGDFRLDRFVERVVQARIATIAWIVAAWMESVRQSVAWGAIRATLESRGHLRRAYASLVQHRLSDAGQSSVSLRLLARVGSDSRRMQVEALAGAAAYVLEMALEMATSARARSSGHEGGSAGMMDVPGETATSSSTNRRRRMR
jgi:Uncharacterised nucleotidyltransferase